MGDKIRINRFLAAAGLGSRRKCEELIRKGLVFVNGESVDKLAVLIDPESDSITVDGVPVRYEGKSFVLVLNKPPGVLSTVTDSFRRKTVIDLAREQGFTDRLFPVGRLDLDTTGIILLTNDGYLAYRLTHPRYKIEKTYDVVVEGRISARAVSRIAGGIGEGDFVTRPCEVAILKKYDDRTLLRVVLREGRKRQIKRMFALCGHKVIELRRIALGDLRFEDLETGAVRPLTKNEERRLRELTGLL